MTPKLGPQLELFAPLEPVSSKPSPSGEVETSLSPQGNEDNTQSGADVQQNKKTSRAPKKRVFGMGKGNSQDYVPQDDYDKKYPPDEFGQEMGPSARVWRVYLDEAELFDRDMVEGWKDGIDVLLVFAGLFSAVVTTFVAQTSQKLESDYGQVSASLLTELISIQRAIATATSLDQVPPSQLTLSSPSQYTRTDAWVNGLWFASLALSLSTALFAVLIKQWIQHYTSFISGSPYERARIHQFRYSGLGRWGVRAIIGILPLLLYMALFLFFVGLAIFLQALKPEIGYMVSAIGGTTFILYVVTNGLPVFYPQCPYRTPLIENIYATISFVLFSLRQPPYLFAHLLASALEHGNSCICSSMIDDLKKRCYKFLATRPSVSQLTPLKAYESRAAEREQDRMTQKIIEWLLTVSSNPSVQPIALQSISGLPVGFSRIKEMLGPDCLVRRELVDEFTRQQSVAQSFGNDPDSLVDSNQFYNPERIVRASIFVPADWNPEMGYWDIFCHPSRSSWKPLSWESFDKILPSPEQIIPFLQALTTYRVLSTHNNPSDTAAVVLRGLSPIAEASSAHRCHSAWKAWFTTLARHLRDDDADVISIVTVYDSLRPLFHVLLKPQGSFGAWADVLSILYPLLPYSLVKESFGGSPDQLSLSSKTLPAARINLCGLLLSCVIAEWDTSTDFRGQSPALEQVVQDSCVSLFMTVGPYDGSDTAVIPRLAAVLDKFVSHEGFAQSSWGQQTYETLFYVYFAVFMDKAAPSPTSDLSSDKHFHQVLENTEWVKCCMDNMFYSINRSPGSPSTNSVSQIARASTGRGANDQSSKNVFDAFMNIFRVNDYLTTQTFSSRYSAQWHSHIQPLVRLLVDHAIDHEKAVLHSHPPIDTFVTNLIERDGFPAFICSSFLIDYRQPYGREVVFSEESSVLGRLVEYHKDNPGAIDAWRKVLSWASKWSTVIHSDTRRHKSWSRTDFDKYARMADFLDQLASTIGIDDPELKTPCFEEEYIVKLLKKYRRPLVTSTSDIDTQAVDTISPNHQNITALTNTGSSEDENSKENHHGTLNMV